VSAALPALVSALSFAFYMALAAPGLTWFDGGELALAAGSLGVAHPPGQPAYLVLARLAALVPIGDLPFRLTLLSAASLSLSAGVASAIGVRLLALAGVAPSLATLGALLSGGLVALGPAAVMQAARPELYALSLLLGLSAAAALLLAGRRGPSLAVLALCVAGAVHYALLVAALPGLAVLAWRQGRGGLREGFVTAAALLVPGLLQYLWLPLRSMTNPVLDFGRPQDWERFQWVVTAGPYRRSFELADGQLLANLWAHFSLAVESLGPLGLVLAALGLGLLGRRAPAIAVAGVLLVLVGILPTVLQGVFHLDNPDLWGYLLLPLAAIACAAAVGAAGLAQRLRLWLPWLPASLDLVLCLAVLLGPALSSVKGSDHSQRFVPARLANAVLDGSPPGAVLCLSGDSWVFPALYQRYWEGRRADLELAPLLQLSADSLAALSARGVDLHGAPSDAQLRRLAAAPSVVRQEQVLRVLGTALGDRPLMVNEAFLPPELEWRKSAEGLLYRIDRPGGAAAATRRPGASEDSLWHKLMVPIAADSSYGDDASAHGTLARRFSSRAGYYRSRGRATQATAALERGVQLQPDPSHMIHLARYRLREGLDVVSSAEAVAAAARGPWMEAFAVADDSAALSLLDRALAEGPAPGTAVSLRLQRAAARLLLGDLDGAGEDLGAVLERRPLHPQATLLQERLYSLGRQVASPKPVTGPATGGTLRGGEGG
jgi:hypothetical protein